MKKLIIIALACLVAVAASASEKKDSKVIVKESKQTLSGLKKDGYRSIEYGGGQIQLEKYFSKVGSGCEGIVGIADNCISVNLAKLSAITSAANEYATISGGELRGRIVNSVSSINGEQLDDIVAGYERLIRTDLKGMITSCATFVKEEPSNRYSVKVFCIVDLEQAHRARIKAMERSLEEAHLAETYGSMAADWVEEGFDNIWE